VDGPVVRETRTESVQARVVVSAPGVVLPPPRDAQGLIPSSTDGQGPQAGSFQRDGVALLGAAGNPVTSQGGSSSANANEPPGGNDPVAMLEGRMVRLEGQVGEMMGLLKQLVAKGAP
jgi:hypothetical protein